MHALRFYLTWEQKSGFNIVFFSIGVGGGGGKGVGNIQLPGKLLPFQSFATTIFSATERCTGFEIFDPVKNTVKVQRFFLPGLSQVFSQVENSQGFSQGFA